jgi:hypothetical protein
MIAPVENRFEYPTALALSAKAVFVCLGYKIPVDVCNEVLNEQLVNDVGHRGILSSAEVLYSGPAVGVQKNVDVVEAALLSCLTVFTKVS